MLLLYRMPTGNFVLQPLELIFSLGALEACLGHFIYEPTL